MSNSGLANLEISKSPPAATWQHFFLFQLSAKQKQLNSWKQCCGYSSHFIFPALTVQIWKKCILIVLTLLPNHSLKPKSGLLARERMVNLKITIFWKVPENISTSSRAASRTAEVNCFFFLGAGRSLAKLARGSLTTKLYVQRVL